MDRLRLGVFVLCAATFALAGCGSDSTGPGHADAAFTLAGAWTSTSVGDPARSYPISFSGGETNDGWTSYSELYTQPIDGQNGLVLVTARNIVNGITVEMTFGSNVFHGNFTSENTVVGTMDISSVDYPITFARAP